MRFGFGISSPPDSTTTTANTLQLPASPPPSTPKEELQWVPLQHHPVFSAVHGDNNHSSAAKTAANLLAWDGASRLYVWDSHKRCLHRISIRLGEAESNTILAASPSKVLQADAQLKFDVYKISINKNGSALLLSGMEGLCVMYLYGRSTSKENTMICRTVSIGSEIYFNKNIIRTLQISWHPYSESHMGILSSDSVFRIFNLSSGLDKPEQEYYLQPIEPGSSRKVASSCPVSFSFGGDHLWDRFSVFTLFSDGSVYILCPVVPFGSVYKWELLLEIYSDAQICGLNSHHPEAVSTSSLAISWLEATFPELAKQAEESGHPLAVKAQPYVLLDSAVSLQGPLRKLCLSEGPDDEIKAAPCEGRAVSFLYDIVGKDTLLITAWSGGQLQIEALADEIQPVWNVNSRPRLSVDVHNHVVGVAMICESVSNDMSMLKLNQPPDYTVWMAQPPLLLTLAIVDLALPNKNETLITMFVDPLISERIYCLHNGGTDSIILHFLPFTNQSTGKDDKMRSPSVNPVLSPRRNIFIIWSLWFSSFVRLVWRFVDCWTYFPS
ncbi:transporter [Lithospermum erythrorhizon]|uniref:Transporter n=1 Tax=Lithospermum erythrorhizon TaxID=34254 RepID=A0AAV3P994_LITER